MQAPENTTENLPVPFEKQAFDVFERVSNGVTIPAAMRELEVKLSLMTFLRRVKKNPVLMQAYDDARVAQAASFAEQIIDIADTERDSARARNMLDARKWLAAKLDPRQFGDRLDLNIEQSVSIRSALQAAEARVLRPRSDLRNVQEAQVIDYNEQITYEPADNESEALNDLLS